MYRYNCDAVSYVYCKNPDSCDGYCLLIKKDIYDKFKLDENFQWWFGVTKIQAQILNLGGNLLAYHHHNHLLYHYGGKSGKDYISAAGMDINASEIHNWYSKSKGKLYIKSALSKGNIFRYFDNKLNF